MNFKSCKEQLQRTASFFTFEKIEKLHTKKSIRNMAEVELVKELMGFLLDPKAEVGGCTRIGRCFSLSNRFLFFRLVSLPVKKGVFKKKVT
jgi:hypothetical protein